MRHGDAQAAMLALLGCGYYKRVGVLASGREGQRFIHRAGRRPRVYLAYDWNPGNSPEKRWQLNNIILSGDFAETQWESGLIETIPETLFVKFVEMLTN